MKSWFLLSVFCVISQPIFAEVPIHKSLQSLQELKLEVCKDQKEADLKELTKDLKKTKLFLDVKAEKARGTRARKILLLATELLKNSIRRSERGLSRPRDQLIEQAFENASLGLYFLFRDEINQLRSEGKQENKRDRDFKKIERAELKEDLALLPLEEQIKLLEKKEEQRALRKEFKGMSFEKPKGRIDLDCNTLIERDEQAGFLVKLKKLF